MFYFGCIFYTLCTNSIKMNILKPRSNVKINSIDTGKKMKNNEFEEQKRAYSNYVKLFYPKLQWTSTIYKDLCGILDENLGLTKVSLGDYFFEQFLISINDNLNIIENEVNNFAQSKNYDKIQKEHIFYHKPFLENRINELIEEYRLRTPPTEHAPEKQPEDFKQQHPKHDPNLWNKFCFELFKYLYDYYYKSTNRQLTNIWFYLKENRNTNYTLKATKEQYKIFILQNYQIKITNFDKAQTKWEDKECNTINDHRINFEDTLKQIAENVKNT